MKMLMKFKKCLNLWDDDKSVGVTLILCPLSSEILLGSTLKPVICVSLVSWTQNSVRWVSSFQVSVKSQNKVVDYSYDSFYYFTTGDIIIRMLLL